MMCEYKVPQIAQKERLTDAIQMKEIKDTQMKIQLQLD